MEIRGFTVKYSKIKSKERKSTETILQSRTNDLFKRAEAEPNNKHIISEIQSIRLRLRKIMQYKTKGAILRSKVRCTKTVNATPVTSITLRKEILKKTVAN